MKWLLDWVDRRTGFRKISRELLYEQIPGGSRWRYVWGSTLLFTFALQVMTGVLLWLAYSPSAQTAWESVYYIQNVMWAGWIIPGIHHFTAQAMVVLLAIHVLQVVLYGAYRPPREFNWWTGLLLMMLVLGLALTGYLLPWDQKGYWSTQVATKIMGITPIIGQTVQTIVIGGPEYGHHTLTRFFALHAGILPALMGLLIAAHLLLFRRHGVTAPKEAEGAGLFWPAQALRDLVACFTVFAVILGLVLWTGGADLGSPADAADSYSAARPEWYYLFLFQFLKYFSGDQEVIGAIAVPGAVVLLLFLLPFIGRRLAGHALSILAVLGLSGGVLCLTTLAILEDRGDGDYQQSVVAARLKAERVKLLVEHAGIPERGAVAILRGDPKTQGPVLFQAHCSSCHRYHGQDGTGMRPGDLQSAPELKGFASRAWLERLFKNFDDASFFGGTHFKGETMSTWISEEWQSIDKDDREAILAALSAEAVLSTQKRLDQAEAEKIARGRKLIGDTETEEGICLDCHSYRGMESAGMADPPGPGLTGYGSREWIMRIIRDPESVYGESDDGAGNDRMPSFAPSVDDPDQNTLSPEEVEILADWVRDDWYEPPSTP